MDDEVQQVRETTTRTGDVLQKTTEVHDPTAQKVEKQNTIGNVVWFVSGVLSTLLGFRFVLALLGANASNGFADFIYSASRPFVSPFFNLFSYDSVTNGISRFEFFTLVAIAFYSLIAWGIVRLVNINRA